MADLKSPRLIMLKGFAFLMIIVLSAAMLLADSPTIRTVLLVTLLIWSSSRFYYFLFYVLEHYVNPSLKYAGILALLREQLRRSRKAPADCSQPHADRPPL